MWNANSAALVTRKTNHATNIGNENIYQKQEESVAFALFLDPAVRNLHECTFWIYFCTRRTIEMHFLNNFLHEFFKCEDTTPFTFIKKIQKYSSS